MNLPEKVGEIVNQSNMIDDRFYLDATSFFEESLPTGLTYDDVSLASHYSEVLPRETLLETKISDRLTLHIPIISADMDTVTESKMAIAMALNGGMGIIHQNMSDSQQAKEVAQVKHHIHGLIQEPIKVTANQLIGDILEQNLKSRFEFSTFPVVDSEGKLIGLLAGNTLKTRFRHKTVAETMTPRDQVVTIQEEVIGEDPIGEADKFFNNHVGINKLPVVNREDHLRGLFTLKDIESIIDESRARFKSARDSKFRLICGAAVPASRSPKTSKERDRIVNHIGCLVDIGIDAVVVSTAHGHTQGVGQLVKLLRDQFCNLTIMAGNVTTAAAVEFLSGCGADAIKVGQGPGSIWTTRLVAGVGIPQLTALYVASKSAALSGVRILADGGITKGGDIVKSLTLADAVICGSLFAGCREAPGVLVEIDGKLYKQYRGMGSFEAMKKGSAARYGHSKKDSYLKTAEEGIEALKETTGTLDEVLAGLLGGVQSGLGYLGAKDLTALKHNARFIRITPAGQLESAPHDVVEIKATHK
tara:strand:+ start:17726 stop:19318 length:1593 start_codon:yes stop_codon:yes gene_type:complete